MTWSYITSNTYSPYGGYDGDNGTIMTNIVAYELSPYSAYVNRINNTVSNFDDKQQNYPSGNTFVNKNGSYLTLQPNFGVLVVFTISNSFSS